MNKQNIDFFFIIVNLLATIWLLFFKSYFKEKGKNLATIKDIGNITKEVESVKENFNKELENFKKDISLDIVREVAALNKENITYQIYNAEYIKLRFQRLDDLYGKLYELKKYCQNKFDFIDEEDFRAKREQFGVLYQKTEDALYHASLYINEDVSVSVIGLLDQCHEASKAFYLFYQTDPKRFSRLKNEALLNLMSDKNEQSLQRLYDCIGKMPTLLQNIETEFKKNLTIDIK
ncbi:MAG TPA: hypothetical protein VNG53_10200 [Bacteroidia bacterium]|nr:hypothetical protein [Bacteroidia bacterium]